MIVCPNCNHQNPDGAVQCEACYTPLPAMMSCPNCGASVQSDASFCGQCGFNLRAAGAEAPDISTPTGEKSNNAVYNASAAGVITAIAKADDGSAEVKIRTEDGTTVVDKIPAGPELIVSEGEEVAAGAALTNNPNVGGFGQKDTEIVLQSPNRVKGLIAFLAAITLTQILLVLKKKQVERVQAAEMSF